jgi:hypothetical protein
MQNALVAALRARRIDVLTAADSGMIGRSDEDHLRHAANDGRVLYSFNIKHFSLLHERWISTGQPHPGIVLGFQQRHSNGEQGPQRRCFPPGVPVRLGALMQSIR